MPKFSQPVLMAALLLLGCSRSDHAKRPSHFLVDRTPADDGRAKAGLPDAGRHYWNGVGKIWIDQWEKGDYAIYEVIGRATIGKDSGTLIADPMSVRDSNVGCQIFIPDIGSESMDLQYRDKRTGNWGDWMNWGAMHGIQ